MLLKLAGVSTNPPEQKSVVKKQNTFEKPIQESSVQVSSKNKWYVNQLHYKL